MDVGDDGGAAVVRCSTSDLGWLARALADQPFPFRVLWPPELLDALERVREAVEAATAASRPLPNAP